MDDLKVQQINDRIMSASKHGMKGNMEAHLVLFYIGGVMLAIYLLYRLGRAVSTKMRMNATNRYVNTTDMAKVRKEKQD